MDSMAAACNKMIKIKLYAFSGTHSIRLADLDLRSNLDLLKVLIIRAD